MSPSTHLAPILLLALVGCNDVAPDEGRLPAGRRGLVAYNASGFEAFTADDLDAEYWYEGFAAAFIAHPIDDAGQPEADHLSIALQFAGVVTHIGPELAWNGPDQLHVLIRQRDDVPRGQRTLFTADMQPPRLQMEFRDTVTSPARRYEGDGQLEVFVADLATGAVWGRLNTELHALDSDDGPYTIRTEFAAFTGQLYCTWEVLDGLRPEVDEPPDGRADNCTPALEMIEAAEAHPDAPPVPDFQPSFYGLQRPPARWDGLDRDL